MAADRMTMTVPDDEHSYETAYAYNEELLLLRPGEQWNHIETTSDSGVYMTWTEPFQRIVLCYAEGDLERVQFDDDSEYADELRRRAKVAIDAGTWKRLGCRDDRTRERYVQLGVEDLT